jgi:hypothetical protein
MLGQVKGMVLPMLAASGCAWVRSRFAPLTWPPRGG